MTFRTQSYWSFIARQCCDSERMLQIHLPHWMWIQSSFYHQFWIDTWRSKFKQETDSILPACWSLGQKAQGSWRDWLECTTSCTILAHWKRHQDAVFFGLTSILRFKKDWNSIRLDRMQSSFKIHFQLIAFQKLLDWKLEKSHTKKYACHLDFRQRCG